LFIMGNSGIGKSTFLFYLAASLHRKQVPVLLSVWNWKAVIYIPAAGAPVAYPVDETLHPDFPEDCWRLYDTMEPKYPLEGKSYVIAGSPGTIEQHNKLRQLAKDSNDWREFVMPVWSLDELQTCATHLLDNGDKPTADDVLKAYVVWGGIPRLVLSHRCAAVADAKLASVVGSSKLDYIIRAIGEVNAERNKISFSLVHFVVTANFTSSGFLLGSKRIADEVYKRYYVQQQRDLRIFLSTSTGLSPYGGIRGHLFESWSHNALRNGGRWPVRRLTESAKNSAPPSLEFGLCGLFTFHHFGALSSLPDGSYAAPSYSNLAAVDSLIKDGTRLRLFQMTVSAEHPVSGSGLQQLLAMFPGHCTVELYFVLPLEVYEKFGVQPYVSTKSQPLERIPEPLRNISQFALLMDVTPTSESPA
jgi:hypothetical protein